MSITFKIKRRTSGAIGAPSSLKAGELAYNQMDNTIYAGFGDDGSGNATSIKAVGGDGAFLTITGVQTISGGKTFTGAMSLGSLATVATPLTADSSTTVVNSAWVKSQAYLTANQTITLSGDVTGSGTTAISVTLPAIVVAGTFAKITFNAKGQVTGGSNLLASDIPSLTHTAISDFDASVRVSRLDQMAMPTASVSLNGQTLTAVANPINPTDAANKQYVDSNIQGLTPKPTATVATIATLSTNTYANGSSGVGATLTATTNAILVVDGYTVKLADLILVKNEAASANNGLYVVTTLGTASIPYVLTRHADMSTAIEFTGAFVPVGSAGGTTANSLWMGNPSGTVTVGTTSIPFTQLNAATQVVGGNGVSVIGTTIAAVGANSGRIVVSGAGIDLASGIVTPGTYFQSTVDTYGRVTAGANPTTLAGFGITNAQGLSANLTALAGLSGTANNLPMFSGVGTMSLASFTAFGQSLVAAVGAAAVSTLLGLGTMSTQAASAVAITGGTIDGIILDAGTF